MKHNETPNQNKSKFSIISILLIISVPVIFFWIHIWPNPSKNPILMKRLSINKRSKQESKVTIYKEQKESKVTIYEEQKESQNRDPQYQGQNLY